MSAPATMPAERGIAPTRGAWLREVWRSSVGKKVIVAITGFVLVLYVIAHVLGNLKAFQSAVALNDYAAWLREVGDPVIPHEGVLWAVRVILLACFIVHIVAVIQLSRRNSAARPAGYPAPTIARSFASRTMLIGGLFLLAFIVFHILHLTTGTIDPDNFAEGAVFHNLDEAFSNPLFVVIYVAASIALALHLHHAIWSAIQTAGWDKPNRNPTIRRISNWTSLAVGVGFAAVPLAFWTGILG